MKSSPKHVAVMGVKGLPAKGGGERVAEAIIKEALSVHHQVTLYAKKSYFEPINIPDKLEIRLIRDLKGKHLSAFSFGLFSTIDALWFKKYDLIHLHYADFGYLVPLLRLRYKVLTTSHGAEYNRDKWGRFAKFCFKLSEIFFVKYSNICTCVSASLTDYYQKKYRKKVIYIANGIDSTKTENISQNVLEKYKLSRDQYILFCSGRIIPSKGCDLLLQANKQLLLKMPLVIIGDMDADLSYKKYLLSYMGDNVRLINFISSKSELFGIIANCRLFVFPSTYEAMSMVLLEVAFLKKGIICSDILENYDTIGNNALFFKSGNIDSLRDKLKYAIEHPDTLKQMGEKAHCWVKENRSLRKMTQSYLKLYDEL